MPPWATGPCLLGPLLHLRQLPELKSPGCLPSHTPRPLSRVGKLAVQGPRHKPLGLCGPSSLCPNVMTLPPAAAADSREAEHGCVPFLNQALPDHLLPEVTPVLRPRLQPESEPPARPAEPGPLHIRASWFHPAFRASQWPPHSHSLLAAPHPHAANCPSLTCSKSHQRDPNLPSFVPETSIPIRQQALGSPTPPLTQPRFSPTS